MTLHTGFGAALGMIASVLSGDEHLVVDPDADPDPEADPDPVADFSQLISLVCCFIFEDRSLVVF